MKIAVKRLQLTRQILDDDSFHAELNILKKLKHKNIVRFLGYCIHTENQEYIHRDQKILVERTERLLCFEYVPNGTIPKDGK
jgi:serine/threonine protein kinase